MSMETPVVRAGSLALFVLDKDIPAQIHCIRIPGNGTFAMPPRSPGRFNRGK